MLVNPLFLMKEKFRVSRSLKNLYLDTFSVADTWYCQ